MGAEPVVFEARILRKEAFLPRYVVVDPRHVAGRNEAFEADVYLDAAGPFRRMVRPWGKGSPVFFFNVTAAQCDTAGLDTHDRCRVRLVMRA